MAWAGWTLRTSSWKKLELFAWRRDLACHEILKGKELYCVQDGEPKAQRLPEVEETAQKGGGKLPVSGGMQAEGRQPLS